MLVASSDKVRPDVWIVDRHRIYPPRLLEWLSHVIIRICQPAGGGTNPLLDQSCKKEEVETTPPSSQFKVVCFESDTDEKESSSTAMCRTMSLSSAVCRTDSHSVEKSVLNKLATKHVWSKYKVDDYGEFCKICCVNYGPGDKIRALPCRHTFHRSCVDAVLLADPACPICQRNVLRKFRPQRALSRALNPTYVQRVNTFVHSAVQSSKTNSKSVSTTLDRKLLGVAVERGPDWKWSNQDDYAGGRRIGITVPGCDEDGWIRVMWRNGKQNNYRVGAEGAYDLRRLQPFH